MQAVVTCKYNFRCRLSKRWRTFQEHTRGRHVIPRKLHLPQLREPQLSFVLGQFQSGDQTRYPQKISLRNKIFLFSVNFCFYKKTHEKKSTLRVLEKFCLVLRTSIHKADPWFDRYNEFISCTSSLIQLCQRIGLC